VDGTTGNFAALASTHEDEHYEAKNNSFVFTSLLFMSVHYKLTIRRKTGLIRGIFEKTGQNASRLTFVGTTGLKMEIWDNPV